MIKHIQDDQARVDLDTGGYLLFDNDSQELLCNGESPLTSVDEKDTFYKIGGELYLAYNIIVKILADWDSVIAEQEQEAADEAAHLERYSSVEGSGRI